MEQNLISQSEAARKYNVSRQYVSRLIKDGKLTKQPGKKVDAQEIKNFFGVLNKSDEDMDYGEARRLKMIYDARLKKLELDEKERNLIPLEDAKKVIDILFSPLSSFLDNLPHHLKTHYPEIKIDAINWLTEEINDHKTAVQSREWEKDF